MADRTPTPAIPLDFKATIDLGASDLEAIIAAHERARGLEVVPGTFRWNHGDRLRGIGPMEYLERYFDGVSYSVRRAQ